MPREKLFPIRKTLTMDEALAARIDEYRRRQKPIPNELDAIRALLDHALAEQGIA